MKKKLLTVLAAICIAISSWAITPQPNNHGAQPAAQFGFTLAYGFYGVSGFTRSGLGWNLASTGSSVFFGTYLGMLYGSAFGPPGVLIGSTVGAM